MQMKITAKTIVATLSLIWASSVCHGQVLDSMKSATPAKLPADYLVADSLLLTALGQNASDKLKTSLGEDGSKKTVIALRAEDGISKLIFSEFNWKPTRGIEPGSFRVFIWGINSARVEVLVDGKAVWTHDQNGKEVLSPQLQIPKKEGRKAEVTVSVVKIGLAGGVNDVLLLRELSADVLPFPVRKVKLETQRPSEGKASQVGLPPFTEEVTGRNELRIRNPNDFKVTAGIRSGAKGKNLEVPANGTTSAFVSDGNYDIYFLYSNQPDAVFQGDGFALKGNGVEIQIVKVAGGNYNIRRVK